MKNQEQYTFVTGCYGARRGTALGLMTQAFVDEEVKGSSLEGRISVLGRGHEKFIGNKAGTPVSDEHIEALESAAKAKGYDENSDLYQKVQSLRSTGRRVATQEELDNADAVYVVDSFARDQYAAQNPSDKYKTVLEATGLDHRVHGKDLDDTESSVDFTNRVIIPKKRGLTPENVRPGDTTYYTMSGQGYRAGSKEARVAEAGDLIDVSKLLAGTMIKYAQRELSC